jgi:hypothetical protein
VFWRYEQFAARSPMVSQWVLDVLEKHSRYGLIRGQRLITLLQSDDLESRFEPVGARPITWAHRDAMYVGRKRRGLE